MNLLDKIVIIVGGSQGFGKALAKGLIAEGAQVTVVGKTQSHVDEAAAELGAKPFVADVRDEKALRAVAEAVIQEFGKIDIWVNSAGVFRKFPKGELLDMERAHEMFDINFFGTVLGSRTALQYMDGQEGILLNVLSSAALDATRSIGAKLYAASKWAVRGYVDALRAENIDSTVKVLSLYSGGMKTHLHDEALPEAFPDFMDPEYVVEKVIANLKQSEPEPDLAIKRPKA